jgi:hypothetical protein
LAGAVVADPDGADRSLVADGQQLLPGRDQGSALAREAAVADGLADLVLVVVHGGGVEMAVADLQRVPDGSVAL